RAINDPVDEKFATGEQTVEGYWTVRGGIEYAIAKARAYAPYADLLWCETAKPDIGEAREFADHVEHVRVRAEIDPAQLSGGQPFPIDLPIPEDADPSFVGQHSAKSRSVRARIDCANRPAILAEVPISVGAQ
ncbi:MAG: hypothetical protein HGB05_22085, partial [Chloroflexi bacterium]|nr:hypothetical protein [Chloroflexota bacterium]